MMKGLKPEVSIPIALSVGTLVWTIYNRGLPPNVDIRSAEIGNAKVESIRKQNAWTAAGIVSAISLVAKDPNIFIVGGGTVVIVDWLVRVNNFTNPLTDRVEGIYEASRITGPTAVPTPVPTAEVPYANTSPVF